MFIDMFLELRLSTGELILVAVGFPSRAAIEHRWSAYVKLRFPWDRNTWTQTGASVGVD
jgi:hypothetical protein